MNPAGKSNLFDILGGIVSCAAIYTIMELLPFHIGMMVIAPLPVLLGYVRGKDSGERILIRVLLMNVLFSLLLIAVLNGVFHLILVVLISVCGTALGIYIRRNSSVKKILLYCCLFAFPIVSLSFFVVPSYLDSTLWTEEASAAPPYQFLSLSGDTLRYTDYKNKVVVMDFWATWCGPCRKQMPVMARLYERYGKNDKVAFLFVNPLGRDSLAQVKSYIEKSGYNLPFVMDFKNKWSKRFGLRSLPTTLLIDKEGIVRFRHTGYIASEHLYETICAHVDKLVARD